MFILFIADYVYACTNTYYALIHVCITILLMQLIQKMERKGGEVQQRNNKRKRNRSVRQMRKRRKYIAEREATRANKSSRKG